MRRSGHLIPRRLFALVAALILVVVAIVVVCRLLSPMSPGSRDRVIVVIDAGLSTRAIAERLVESKVIGVKASFYLAHLISGRHHRLLPGAYELSPGMSAIEIAQCIENGRVSMSSVTFPEGWTLVQMADLLQRHDICQKQDFLRIAHTEGRIMTSAGGFTPPSDDMEGFLFPDTYRFGLKSDPHTVISVMLGEFDHRVVRHHSEVKDWRRVVTVASLVEGEARLDVDRPLIAGVIDNRLKKGMRLQIDATVEYALPKHKSRLLYSDLKVDSPYNTYRHAGLPPGPICCPGLPSIEASIHPTPSSYLFYVLGPGKKHIFTNSLSDHDAVRHMLSLARQRKAAASS